MGRFAATRAEALAQLREYAPRVAAYRSGRNHILPGHPHVSQLSPPLRCRLITEEEILAEIQKHCSFARAEKFVQEILWRSYWKAWLEARPHVWADYRSALTAARSALATNEVLRQKVQAVQSGNSGVALMDYFARELMETGYLHNHARMWWASFWIHVERLPWELGADFFYRHLLDADPASNTLSWRWVAGLQTKGKTYLVRRSNLEKYVAQDILRDHATGLERLNDDLVQPHLPLESLLPHSGDSPHYETPDPTFQPTRWGLWLHGEDLCPESAPFPSTPPVRIQGVISPDLVNQFGLSPARVAYMRTALQDGLTRAAEHWQRPGELGDRGTLSETIENWIQRDQLQAVYALRPFTGPLTEELGVLQNAVEKRGAKLIFIQRLWDLQCRPWAERGYFNFWEQAQSTVAWSRHKS